MTAFTTPLGEQRYLDLEVRLAQAPSREDRHSLVREAARLLRDP